MRKENKNGKKYEKTEQNVSIDPRSLIMTQVPILQVHRVTIFEIKPLLAPGPSLVNPQT